MLFRRSSRKLSSLRKGATYLEIQVAMVMLAIGMSGLYSMSVVQSRQASRLTRTLPPDEVAAINQAPSSWARKLGVYASVDETLVTATPVDSAPVSVITDDQDPSTVYFSDPGDAGGWHSWNPGAAHGETARFHPSTGLIGSYAQFNATVTVNGHYDVLITYPNYIFCGDVIECEIYDGSVLVGTRTLNQKTAPSDEIYLSRPWDFLGTYEVTSNSLSVRLKDGPGAANYIIADAIRLRPRHTHELVSVTKTTDGGATAVLEVLP